ncbi:OmpP1/FadL family transporter [Thalassobius sp. MITS945101]|uniref:OmpP1/FadL family transporter n=1 Tax=Thalassobius sp. MITS945101 TaxID=3096994 RepID=UPI00399A3BFC
MQRYLVGAAVLALTAGTAQAGGIDRSGQGIGFMFEEGNVVELTFGSVSPSVSGVAAPALGSTLSGDMSPTYSLFSVAYKQQFTDQFSFGIMMDQPFGADVNYATGTGYPFAGATASVDSNALTAIGRYEINENFSVHAGLRAVQTKGQVNNLPISLPGIYNMSTDTQTDYGYLVGVAYEIPDIALRAALTYNSEVTHNLNLTEAITTGLGTSTFSTQMTTVMPQSVNLDFQTGIAADTLLMASVRWVDWGVFDITPAALGAALVDYDSSTTTYSLGVGRKFNDMLSGSVSVGYEKPGGDPVGNLGPTDGNTSLGVAMKYSLNDSTSVSAGVRHIWIGDATTSTIGSTFADNTGWAAGLKLSHSF